MQEPGAGRQAGQPLTRGCITKVLTTWQKGCLRIFIGLHPKGHHIFTGFAYSVGFCTDPHQFPCSSINRTKVVCIEAGLKKAIKYIRTSL